MGVSVGRGKKGEEKVRGRRVERVGTNVSLFCGSGDVCCIVT